MSFASDVKDELRALPPRALGDPDGRLLRQAFLDSGSMSDPGKGYHLEYVCAEEDTASDLISAAAAHEVKMRRTLRGEKHVIYCKDGEDIVQLLGVMGATRSLMQFENLRITKDMRGRVNRRVNCETANIEKTVNAAAKQLQDILYLEQAGVLDRLEQTLKDVAEVRLAYPDATLTELGAHLTPPLGKSGVNHRLRRLSDIATKERNVKQRGA